MILVADTANQEARMGLWEDGWLSTVVFNSGRELNLQILKKLIEVFAQIPDGIDGEKPKFEFIAGIIANAGPGSFTGLRIGISVLNTLAYSQDIPIVGIEAGEKGLDFLLQEGQKMLESAGPHFEEPIVPMYGADPNITVPKIRT